MTSGAIENDSIELAVLKNPDIDTEIVSLSLLEVTLAQDSSLAFRLKLQTPSMGGSSPSLKESMIATEDFRTSLCVCYVFYFRMLLSLDSQAYPMGSLQRFGALNKGKP